MLAMSFGSRPIEEAVAMHQKAAEVGSGSYQKSAAPEQNPKKQTTLAASGFPLRYDGESDRRHADGGAKPAMQVEQSDRNAAVSAEVGVKPAQGNGQNRANGTEQHAYPNRR
jgi:hypothetical protein